MGIFDKAQDMANQHPHQVNQGIDKAGDLFDEKTGGQHAGMTDKVQEAAKGQFGGQQAAPAEATPEADAAPAEAQDAQQAEAQPGNEPA